MRAATSPSSLAIREAALPSQAQVSGLGTDVDGVTLAPTHRSPHTASSWAGADSLKAMFDALPVAAFVCDLDLRLAYISPAALKVLGALRSVVRGHLGVDAKTSQSSGDRI